MNINAPTSAIHINHHEENPEGTEQIEITGGEVNLTANSRAFQGKTITVGKNAKLNVQVKNGDGLSVTEGRNVTLASGTYTGSTNAFHVTAAGATLADLLAPGYAIFNEDGTGVDQTETSTGPGTFTVKKCQHEGVKATPNDGDTTHSITCPYCGYTGTAETCAYETWVDQGDGTHKGVCVCGRETEPEAHSIIPENWTRTYEYPEAGNNFAIFVYSHSCEKECGYVKTDGKIVPPPGTVEIPYGQAYTLSIDTTLPNPGYQWKLEITGGADTEFRDLGTESSCTIPNNLDVSEAGYQLSWYVSWDGNGGDRANGQTDIYVIPATLSGKPTFVGGEGKLLKEVEVKLPAEWPVDGTFTWADDPEAQVVQGKSYSYTFTAENYSEVKDSVVLWAKPYVPPVDPDPGEPDEPLVPDGTATKLEITEGITEVPPALAALEHLNTPQKLAQAMRTAVTQTGVPEEDTAVYDVELQISTDGGKTWTPATKENFPSGGLVVTLPYPAGTDSSYTFTVVHMFTTAAFGKTPGGTETPPVTNTADGLRFTVTGLSPISVGWKAAEKPVEPEKPTTPSRPSGGGGGVSTYAVTVERAEHGRVTASRTWAGSGSTITLTVTPDSGYELDTLTVIDSRGNAVRLTDQGGGKYTFPMPARAVTVKAEFRAVRAEWSNPYSDVSEAAWYCEAVQFVTENGLMDGYGGGQFGPDDALTRAQFVRILHNREGNPVVNYLMGFEDVPGGVWYAEAVRWAASQGIVSGFADRTFAPDVPITREQLAVMLWRYAGSPDAGGTLPFPDADQASGYALDALRWAVENGIMSGKSGGLAPKGNATRAEAAAILMRYLNA